MKKFNVVALTVLFSSSVYATETNVPQDKVQEPAETPADTSVTIIKSDLPGTFYKRTLLDSITAIGALGSFYIQ